MLAHRKLKQTMETYIGCRPYIICSLLDINTKGCVFTAEQKTIAWDLLVELVTKRIEASRPVVPPALPVIQPAAHAHVPVAREVNFMQSLLSQQEHKEEELDIPVADAVMEARREINIYKAYPQDVTLSTSPREWWINKRHMPNVRFIPRKYLPFPVGERC